MGSFQYIPAYTGNYTKNRAAYGGKISEITIHHIAGIMTVEDLGKLWQTPGRGGSSHYGVQHGNIAQYVKEEDIAWTNGGANSPHGWAANCRAVTIETSNSGGAPNWPVADDTLQTLIRLVADIAERNGLYPLVPGKNLTWHSMYAATACPGPYLKGKFQYIADQANKIIASGTVGEDSSGNAQGCKKMKIYAENTTPVSSALLSEGGIALSKEDGLHLYAPRMAREVTDETLSPVYESMKEEMRPGELIAVVD